MPPVLVKALLRYWWTPELALAFARTGLVEAEATGCPLRIREYRTAVRWLEWINGSATIAAEPPTDEEIAEVMKYRQPPLLKPNSHRIMRLKLMRESERG
jgi:hypothetical protein